MEILKRAAVLLLSGAIILSGGVNVGAEQPEEVSTAAESALYRPFRERKAQVCMQQAAEEAKYIT